MRLWLRMLVREIAHRRGRMLAVGLATCLGVALFVASYGAYRNLVVSYDAMYQRTAAADLTVSGGDVAAFVRAAREDPAVATVATRNVVESYARIEGHRLLARVVGMPVNEQPAVNQVLVLQGDYLAADRRDGVMLERHLAEHYDLVPGDTIEVRGPLGWERVPVVGVAASPEYLWPARSRQEVLTSPENFGVLFAAQGPLRMLAGGTGRQAMVLLADEVDRAAAMARLEKLALEHGANDVTPRAEQPSNAVLREDIEGFGQMAVLFPALFLAAAGLAAFVVIGRLVHARRTLIGTLRANGVRRGAVLGYHLAFALVPTGVGAVIGAFVGEGLAAWVSGLYTGALSIPVTVIRPHPWVGAAGVAMALAAVAVAALAPAWEAARVAPGEAMRGVRPSRGASRLLRRLPATSRLPASVKLVLRSTLRSPGRSLTTIAGVALSLILVLTSLGMLDTVQVLLSRQFARIQTQEAEVYLSDGAGRSARRAVRNVEGVARAEEVLTTEAVLTGSEGRYTTQLRAFGPETRMHTFLAPDGTTTRLPEEGVLVAASLRERIGLEVGQRIRVELPTLGREARLRVAGFVEEPLGSFVYAALPVGAAGLDVAPNAMYLRYEEGADRASVRARLGELDSVLAVVDARTIARAVDDLMGLFYALVGVMLVFGGVLAFALIFATMAVNVAERSGELATLRATGVRRGQVARIVGGENLVLVLLGLAPGMLIAWLTADAFLATFSSDMFRFDLHVRPLTWVAAASAVVVAALLSELPALREVDRLDLARAVRARSG